MKFKQFQVYNYRNVHDSGPIRVNDITAFVGQNESGKSNLFEALYRVNPFDEAASYNLEEDWPIDRWEDKENGKPVCEALFELNESEISSLFDAAEISAPKSEGGNESDDQSKRAGLPKELTIKGIGYYGHKPHFWVRGPAKNKLDKEKANNWAKANVPSFVLIRDYELSGSQIELNDLQQRKSRVSWDNLSPDEQTISTVLDLAKIDLNDFVSKGAHPAGRTTRSFDRRAASAYLSRQFQKLWTQKDVTFELDIDGTTFNIFAQDTVVGFPVRLSHRSTGFRWYVSFAWKFTHASGGQFENCIILLEEPGIHLHYSAQRDLLKVFDRLIGMGNTILYTTHLASMVDLGFPERIRLVENLKGSHATVKAGVVSSQRGPMAVIEMCLGLTGNMSGLLGNRKTLIVEGGDDALILNKLSGVLREGGNACLSDAIHLWTADTASRTPMYAAYAIGNKWQSGVLLDSDEEGQKAKKKIQELHLSELAEQDEKNFRVLMLADAAGIKKTDAAIEDIFPDDFYIGVVNEAYGFSITESDLPVDGPDNIKSRVKRYLNAAHSLEDIDSKRVLAVLLKRFEEWRDPKDLPKGTAAAAGRLFKKINAAFEIDQVEEK